jgi:cell division protease FtsH
MRMIERIKKFFEEMNPDRFFVGFLVFALIMTFVGGVAFSYAVTSHYVVRAPQIVERVSTDDAQGVEKIDYGQFMSLVKDHKIKSARIDMNVVNSVGTDGIRRTLRHDRWLYSWTFPKELVEAGVEVSFADPSENAPELTTGERIMGYVGIATQVLFFLMFIALMVFLFVSLRSMTSFGWKPKVVKSDVRFSDVAGQDESKRELSELLSFLTKTDAYEKTGAQAPKGILLVGPPGTGKTLLAKALAGEAKASFITVTGSDFSNRFIGAGKERVETLFKVARKNKPCIIFIDEIDSVAGNRSAAASDGSKEHSTTINKLLTEMDGFKNNEGVFVVGATNRIDVLDPAILRPGRFDRHIHVNVSDVKGREEILEVHVRGLPLSTEINLKTIARSTAGFSGAALRNLVNEAAIHAARRDSAEIETEDFDSARDKILVGVKREGVVISENEKAVIAMHEAGHAVIAASSENADPIHVATIIPRGAALGFVMQLPDHDTFLMSRSRLLTKLKILMGGRAAEELAFGEDEVTSGASGDIDQATRIATDMVTRYGMDAGVGMRRVEMVNGALPAEAEAAVQRLLVHAKEAAKAVLVDRKAGLDALAAALLVKETIYGDEVRSIIASAITGPKVA